MKYLDEYRDGKAARDLAKQIAREATKPWVVMEVCGGQTHSIVRHGLHQLLPANVELVHGPGCPVCVTSLERIDRAHAIAEEPGVIFCSFGDMLRVPGSAGDLLQRKSRGSDVRIVYSTLDALKIAENNPSREVVFFAIGFETTAPANAMAVALAHRRGIRNFSLLVSHVLVPPAMRAILSEPDNRVQGFLGPGHVCAVMGLAEYRPITKEYGVPIVVTGFEPVDMLEGILKVVRSLERGDRVVENQYGRSVREEGNPKAREVVDSVFHVIDQSWRGIGEIPKSGYNAARRIPRARRGTAFPRRARICERAGRVHRRTDLARRSQATRLPGLRQTMHARASARRHDGLRRGGLRRLLRLRKRIRRRAVCRS